MYQSGLLFITALVTVWRIKRNCPSNRNRSFLCRIICSTGNVRKHWNIIKCFGNKHELTQQFKDVQKLSRRVEKPVLHLSLRLAPGETLTKDHLIEMGRACAKEFGVPDNQYICVLHKDTKEQHIHIAANRVGFNGKVASDSNSYKRGYPLPEFGEALQLERGIKPSCFPVTKG